MKKLGIMIMALALVTVFTQCKKEQPEGGNDTPVLVGETYSINLSLSSSNGSRSGVDPNDDLDIAPVHYVVGDEMHVAYNGQWVGTLECTYLSDAVDINGDRYGVFEGEITLTKDGDRPLYFYFFGNRTPVVSGDNDVLTVDISDQSGELPVISYAPSVQNFSEEVTSYTVQYNWLRNQCALVKFECENIYDMSANSNDNNPQAIYTTTKDITIFGMDNQVTVNLGGDGDAQFSWGQKENSRGAIKLFCPANEKADSVRYAIVHHMDYSGVTEGELEVSFDPASDQYGFFGTYKIAHNVVKNEYFDNAKLDLVWHSGAFTVASGQQVVFSRGNLQYKHYGSSTADGGTWRFAKHQYDFVGGTLALSSWGRIGNVVLMENVANDLGLSDNELIGNGSYVGWIDLFGWGTGDDPTKHSILNSNYNDWHEWGAHNVVNSGKPANSSWWSTLSHHEWKYLLSERTDYSSKRGTGTVNGVKGFIILPDNSSASIVTYSNQAQWNNNVYTEEQWVKYAEAYGAVFLPAAGYRSGADYDGGTGTQQDHGAYWSSSQSTSAASWGIRFKTTSNYAYLEDDYAMAPDNGHAVRLVHRL